MPSGASIADSVEDASKASDIELAMPFLSNIMLILLLVQLSFLITTFETMAKWVSLTKKGIIDATGFLLFEVILLTFFYFVFKVLGVVFDDGANMDSEYDEKHNDYKNVDPSFVAILAVFRSSIGDLQPPQYPYWDELVSKKRGVATFYIRTIWVMWIIMIVINVIFLLNFLIAIVSQSYEELIESQEKAILNSKLELNMEFLFMNKNSSEINRPTRFLVMATMKDVDADGEWHGLTRKVRQTVKHFDERSSLRDNALSAKVTKNKEQIDRVESKVDKAIKLMKQVSERAHVEV